ncbi:MAG: hypothetical protein ABI867_19340 [Kofleriaceae bacterium]
MRWLVLLTVVACEQAESKPRELPVPVTPAPPPGPTQIVAPTTIAPGIPWDMLTVPQRDGLVAAFGGDDAFGVQVAATYCMKFDRDGHITDGKLVRPTDQPALTETFAKLLADLQHQTQDVPVPLNLEQQKLAGQWICMTTLSQPKIIAPSLLATHMTFGQAHVLPDAATLQVMRQDGKVRILTVYKLCVRTDGEIGSYHRLNTSGYPAYDHAIEVELAGRRYAPYVVNGAAVAVCSALTFTVQP